MEVNLTFGEGTADSGTETAADDTESVLSLYRWLVAEPELRGHARVSTESGSSPAVDYMGDGLELVNVVLANSIALGSLVTAVVTWRGTRPRPPQVRLERDGVVVTLQDNSPEQVERILRMWNEGSVAAPAPGPADGDSE